jgi:hypothetical protein
MAFLAGAPAGGSPRRETVTARRTVEFTGVPREAVGTHEVPSSLGLASNKVMVYPGAFSSDHVYVDVGVEVERAPERSLAGDCEVEMLLRTRSLEGAEYLVGNGAGSPKDKLWLGCWQAMPGEDFDTVAAGAGRPGLAMPSRPSWRCPATRKNGP